MNEKFLSRFRFKGASKINILCDIFFVQYATMFFEIKLWITFFFVKKVLYLKGENKPQNKSLVGESCMARSKVQVKRVQNF